MTGRLALALVALAVAAAPSAQEIRPLAERVSTAPGYYVYALPGEATTQVSVFGTVRSPGLYVVSSGSGLAEVLALAGGPAANAQSTDVERTVTVRVFRGAGTRDLIYEATAPEFARDASAYPRLADGDLVEVTTVDRRLRTYRDTLTVVGAAASVVVAVVQILRLF